MRVFVNVESITSLRCCYQLSNRFFYHKHKQSIMNKKHDIQLAIKRATIYRSQNVIDIS